MHLMKKRMPPLLHTPLVGRHLLQPSRHGFDHVYVVNLQRRRDRRVKMAYAMRLFGGNIRRTLIYDQNQGSTVNSTEQSMANSYLRNHWPKRACDHCPAIWIRFITGR